MCQEIDGYVGYHMYRTEGTGGGVSVYVRSTLPSSFMPQFSSVAETSEICAVEIALGDGNRNDRYRILGIYNDNKIVKKTFRDHSASNIEDLCN